MKILVCAHRLELGGTQTNAIDLSTALRDVHGHDVTLFAAPGPNEALVAQRGLPLILSPDGRSHPSPAVMAALARVVRERRPDVLHVWDWPQCYNAVFAGLVRHGVPIVCSSMEMLVSRAMPRSMSMTYGTPALVRAARSHQTGPLALLEPTVDVVRDDPDVVDGGSFRAAHGIGDDEVALVVVSRLIAWLKLEGIRRTIDAVDQLAGEAKLRLVIVGEGTAAEQLAAQAAAVNSRHGREVVSVPGPMLDPRAAYAGADVVVGMGGSALRGMAFGKPVVVLGEQGFSEVLTPRTAELFLDEGFYGLGSGSAPLVEQLAQVMTADRAALGSWGRQLVLDRYAVGVGAGILDGLLRDAVATGPARLTSGLDGVRAVTRRAVTVRTPTGVKQLAKRVLAH